MCLVDPFIVPQRLFLGLTPNTAYRNSTGSDDPSDYFPDSLILNLTDTPDVSAPPGLYGLVVAEVGDAHGMVSAVAAVEGEQQFDFAVADGRSLWLVYPRRRNGDKIGLKLIMKHRLCIS